MKLITKNVRLKILPTILYNPDEIERDFVFIFIKNSTQVKPLLIINYPCSTLNIGFSYHYISEDNTIQIDFIQDSVTVYRQNLICGNQYKFRIVFYPQIHSVKLSIFQVTRTMLKTISTCNLYNSHNKKLCYLYEHKT
jgi:hypothetical protein